MIDNLHKLNRRDAIKLATVSVGTMCNPTMLNANNNPTSASNNYDVIVIGAGAAGMQAAQVLISNGYTVKVLEATQHIGGRIHSATLGSTRIDLGAEEHYLNQNNPIYDAVTNKFGKNVYTKAYAGETLLSIDDGQSCWESDSGCLEDTDIKNFWNYYSFYGDRSKHKDYSISLADDILVKYGVDKQHRAYHLYENGFAGSIFGSSMTRIGAASLAEQDWKWTLSEDIRVLAPKHLGYSDVLNEIWWNTISHHVALNTAVKQIDYSGEHIRITDEQGTLYHCHKVIITASIGTLQKEIIHFIPSLPEQTVEAYTNIGMGNGMKIALRFSKPVWDD